MARATYGPGENEWTLVLTGCEEGVLMTLLDQTIDKLERRRRRDEWITKDTLEQIRRALSRAQAEVDLLFSGNDTPVQ